MIIITTCRRPTRRLRSFVKDLAKVIPNSIRVNRGKMSLKDLIAYSRSLGARMIILVGLRHGNPGIVRFIELTEFGYTFKPPIIQILSVRLIREIKAPYIPAANSIITCTFEKYSEKLKLFTQEIAENIMSPYIELSDISDIKGVADVILLIEENQKVFAKILFLEGTKLFEIGPRIIVKGAKIEA